MQTVSDICVHHVPLDVQVQTMLAKVPVDRQVVLVAVEVYPQGMVASLVAFLHPLHPVAVEVHPHVHLRSHTNLVRPHARAAVYPQKHPNLNM